MANRKSDSDYSKSHDEKAKAKQIPFKLYQSKDDEKKVSDFLDLEVENKKSYLLDLIKEDMRKKGYDI